VALVVVDIKWPCVALLCEAAVVLSSVFLTPLVVLSESEWGRVGVRVAPGEAGTEGGSAHVEGGCGLRAGVAVGCHGSGCASAGSALLVLHQQLAG